MATLTPKVADPAGVVISLAQAASAGGDAFANNGREMVLVTNTHATLSRTVTVVIPANASRAEGKTIGPRTVTVAALTSKLLGPYKPSLYNDSATGRTSMTYSTEADLKVEVIDPTPA